MTAGRVLPLLALAGLFLSSCDGGREESAPPPPCLDTPEDLCRFAVGAMKAGSFDALAPAVPGKADIDELLDAYSRKEGGEEDPAVRARAAKSLPGGGVSTAVDRAVELNRVSFRKTLERAPEALDWERARFDGMDQERTKITGEPLFNSSDLWFQVAVGDDRFLFKLDDCYRAGRGWVCTSGLRYLGGDARPTTEERLEREEEEGRRPERNARWEKEREERERREYERSKLDNELTFTEGRMINLLGALGAHVSRHGRLPKVLEELQQPYRDLAPLIKSDMLNDAWGRAFAYEVLEILDDPEFGLRGKVRIRSVGPDGVSGNADDLVKESQYEMR